MLCRNTCRESGETANPPYMGHYNSFQYNFSGRLHCKVCNTSDWPVLTFVLNKAASNLALHETEITSQRGAKIKLKKLIENHYQLAWGFALSNRYVLFCSITELPW